MKRQLTLVVYYRHGKANFYYYVPDLNFPVKVRVEKDGPRATIEAWLKSNGFPEATSIRRFEAKENIAWLCELEAPIEDRGQFVRGKKWETRRNVVHSPMYSYLLAVLIQVAHDHVLVEIRRKKA